MSVVLGNSRATLLGIAVNSIDIEGLYRQYLAKIREQPLVAKLAHVSFQDHHPEVGQEYLGGVAPLQKHYLCPAQHFLNSKEYYLPGFMTKYLHVRIPHWF
tara:strand:- start:1359 stop:1661 length:303 start_codon:yes stop_codon:yes gene_type:complete